MGIRYLCVLLTVVVLGFVLCDAQSSDDPHTCIRPVTVPKTRVVYVRCRKTGTQLCRKIKREFVKVNTSVCCEGWVFSDEGKCVPKCDRGCKQGTCIAPETCACEPPLILRNNNSCEEPQCNPPCVNGTCVDDNKCKCNAGFGEYNATHCAPICPEGFGNDLHTLECKPKCNNCNNGTCTAPDTCICTKGYILENSTCVPHCNQSCKNGQCIAPNTCECSVGYSIDPESKSICHPICETSCRNATCVEPNKCACDKGYEYLDPWTCIPKCDHCDHGDCVAPNQCHCSDGYFKIDGKTCMPVCSENCSNGYCFAPNTCKCDKGYELNSKDKFKCQPMCEDNCINATCSSPDTCTCYHGYHKLNSSVCKPFCTSCEHGSCVAPEECLCNDGFSRTNGTCMPICSSPCINGFCESPGKCACNEGYLKKSTESVCHKPCIGECDNGICTIDGKCECNSGFELFNHTCIIPEDCNKCNGTCPDCRCENGRPCLPSVRFPAEAAPSTSLAGLQITWLLGACVAIFLVTITVITIGIIWRKRKEYGDEPTDDGNTCRSVLYTVPNTLIQKNFGDNRARVDENEDEDAKDTASVHLLEMEKMEARRSL